MKLIKQHWQFENVREGAEILRHIERCGRTCYKSEGNNLDHNIETTKKFVTGLMNKNHESVLEHENISVRIITNRGVTHELVRHRLASYSQESTRYCNYTKDKFGDELTMIMPVWFYDLKHDEKDHTITMKEKSESFKLWEESMLHAESQYKKLIELGQTPQEAREILPNSLKTDIVVTMNLRSWKHFFNLRAVKAAHPQMRELALDMLLGFKEKVPVIFDNLEMH